MDRRRFLVTCAAGAVGGCVGGADETDEPATDSGDMSTGSPAPTPTATPTQADLTPKATPTPTATPTESTEPTVKPALTSTKDGGWAVGNRHQLGEWIEGDATAKTVTSLHTTNTIEYRSGGGWAEISMPDDQTLFYGTVKIKNIASEPVKMFPPNGVLTEDGGYSREDLFPVEGGAVQTQLIRVDGTLALHAPTGEVDSGETIEAPCGVAVPSDADPVGIADGMFERQQTIDDLWVDG